MLSLALSSRCVSSASCVCASFLRALCLSPNLRWRNARYRNPELVAQHCFVAGFCRCFPFFTLRDQLGPQQKHLFRVEDRCCGLNIGAAKSRALVYFEQQILALFLVFHRAHNLSRNKCRHLRSTPSKSTNQRAAFLQPTTDFIVARRVDRAR